jgi:putative regulator of septum formation
MRLLIRFGIIGVIALGGFVMRDRLTGNVGDLKVGDCIDRPTTPNETVSDVQHHPCDESHTAEVVYVGTNPAAKDTPPPTDDQWLTFLAQTCVPAFDSYTGTDIMSGNVMDLGAITPLDDDWNKGTRDVTCYAYRLDGGAMTGSIKKH